MEEIVQGRTVGWKEERTEGGRKRGEMNVGRKQDREEEEERWRKREREQGGEGGRKGVKGGTQRSKGRRVDEMREKQVMERGRMEERKVSC